MTILLTQGCAGMRRSSEGESGPGSYSGESVPISGQTVESETIEQGSAGNGEMYGPELPTEEAQPLDEAAKPEAPAQPAVPKLCLVLGPGFARGIAHAGVIEALVRSQVPIHCIVGVEMGAVVGAFYAMSASVNTMQWQLFKVNKDNLFNFPLITFGAKRSSGKEFHKFLREIVDDRSIESLKIRFLAVATQPSGAQPVVIDSGNVADALSASVAQPGVFEAWKLGDGRRLVGGAVSSPSPVEIARKAGATFVVLVSVLPEPGEPAGRSGDIFEKAFVPVLNLSRLQERGADIVIRPELRDAAYDDFSQLGSVVAAGRERASELADEIKQALERSLEEHKARAE